MKFTVEQWSPQYASPLDADAPSGGVTTADVVETIERPLADWAPIAPPPHQTQAQASDAETGARGVLFIDGVQRLDAFLYIETPEGTRPGICASYAAGAVRCDDLARLESHVVERSVFSASPIAISTPRLQYRPRHATGDTTELLRHAIGEAMTLLEAQIASAAAPAALTVLDGPIRAGSHIPGAIGYVKTHHVRYLSPQAQKTLADLAPGERTPVFMMTTSWSRFSWYLRLPHGQDHEWGGIVRCEASSTLEAQRVIALADRATALLPRFASLPHKDPRAPQNLYPIGGLERQLHRRLGDRAYVYRELRAAAARPA